VVTALPSDNSLTEITVSLIATPPNFFGP
jgi:hypothetical protein